METGEGVGGARTDQYFKCEDIDSNFTIISQNIRSYGKHRDELIECITRVKNVKLILLQEIWQRSPQMIPGFQPIEGRYRKFRVGGGVGFFIDQGLNYTLLDTPFDEGTFESQAFETTINRKCHIFINIYCPHKLPIKVVSEYLTEILKDIEQGKSVSIFGDLNIDIQKPNNFELIDIMASYGFASLIQDPTRVKDESKSTIDLLFTNDSTLNGGIFPLEISDHYTIFATLETGRSKKMFKEKPLCDIRSMEYMRDWMKCVDWKPVLEDNTKTTFDKFSDILSEARKICCPSIKVGTKIRISQPWFTLGLKVSRIYKEKLAKKARAKQGVHKEVYVKYRNVYNKLCKFAKIKYYSDLFKQYEGDPKMLWKTADEVVGRNKNEDYINIKGCSSDQQQADKFNLYFANIAVSLANKMPTEKADFREYLKLIDVDTKMEFSEVYPSDILKILTSLKPKTSFSFDCLSNKLIKFLKFELALPLSHIINTSLKLAYVPQNWKEARCVPIFKKGNRQEVGNYRPICLLSTISKICEKVVAHQITNYMEQNHLFYSKQFGYRAKHSCQDLLIQYFDFVYRAKNKKENCLTVMLDLSKAFDTIPKNILYEKLRAYGLPVEWFVSYLESRNQRVNIRADFSRKLNMLLGVPQGSVLGSLIFILFTNEIHKVTSMCSLLFADDSTFCQSNCDLNELFEIVNNELSKLESWFITMGLTINPKKTRYICYTNEETCPDLWLGGEKIIRIWEGGEEPAFKLLGVWIDPSLTFQYQINQVHKKVQNALSYIIRSKKSLPFKIRLMLYRSLVLPHLHYCSVVWGSPSSHTDKLQIALKKGLRMICGVPFMAHADPLFVKTNTLKYEDIYKFNVTKLAFNVINNTSLPVTSSLFDRFEAIRRPGPMFQLKEPFSRTDTLKRLPTAAVPKIWNSLCPELYYTNGSNEYMFKICFKALKKFEYSQFECNIIDCKSCQS